MGCGLSEFRKMSSNAFDPQVVYAGGTFDGVAANFAEVARWCL